MTAILCLIRALCITRNNDGITLVELMIGVGFSVLLMAGVYGFYSASSQVYSSGIAGQNLQDGANIVLSKMTEGDTESGNVYRLATSETYTVANGGANALYTCGGTQQAAACNANNAFSELYFCQDNPAASNPAGYCNYTDATARWYYLNAAGTSVMYHYPGVASDVAIYTAPANSALKLRFSEGQSGGVLFPNVIEIDVDLSKNAAANITNGRVLTSGSASTFVFLRNHP